MPHPFPNHCQQFYAQTIERIYFRDQAGNLIWANPSFLRDLGCDCLEAVLGTAVGEKEVRSADVASVLLEAEKKALETRQSQTKTHVHCDVDGVHQNVSLEIHPVTSDAGEFDGIVCKYSVEALNEQLGQERTLIANLMKNSDDCVYFKDLDSKFILASDSLVERVGAESAQAVIGKSDFDYWSEDCAAGFFQTEQDIIKTGQPMVGQCEQETRPDGRTSWVISTKMPLVDSTGAIVGTFGISKDITKLKETELKLEDTNLKLLEASRQAGMAEIATNVIHNVGNVLNSINISIAMGRDLSNQQNAENLYRAAELLDQNKNVPDYLLADPKGRMLPGFFLLSAEKFLEIQAQLSQEFENLRKHLDHIKTVISMQQEYAGAKYLMKKMKVSELVDDAIQIGEGTLARSGIKVVKNYTQDFEADVDQHRLLQVLINLIRNAKHACEDNTAVKQKQIEIKIDKPTENFFTIVIKDNGVGIAKENLTAIFNHGFTTKEKGKGFGLHSSANTAKEVGGSLVASSPGPGLGASFILTLPIHGQHRQSAAPTAAIGLSGAASGGETTTTPA